MSHDYGLLPSLYPPMIFLNTSLTILYSLSTPASLFINLFCVFALFRLFVFCYWYIPSSLLLQIFSSLLPGSIVVLCGKGTIKPLRLFPMVPLIFSDRNLYFILLSFFSDMHTPLHFISCARAVYLNCGYLFIFSFEFLMIPCLTLGGFTSCVGITSSYAYNCHTPYTIRLPVFPFEFICLLGVC